MKKILLVSIIIALLAGTWAVFQIFSDDSIVKEDPTTTIPVVVENKPAKTFTATSGTSSINALLALGEDMECSISHHVEGSAEASTEGTLFTSQNRMRGDFLIPEMGADAVSSMISQKGDLYFWTEIGGKKNGMKISLNELSTTKKNDNTPEAGEVIPLDELVTYQCKPWLIVDGSIFEPPTDIIFTNYGDVISTGMEYGTVYEEEEVR